MSDVASMPATARLPADWTAPPGVHAFTTLRQGAGVSLPPFDQFNLGSRCGDAADAVQANRSALATTFGLPSPPHWLRQVHGIDVVRFDAPATLDSSTSEPDADAAVTSTAGVVLAVLTADCLPVVFAARDGSEVAVAHAGWRGLCAGVLEATLAAMRTPATHVVAWMGPAAGPDAYEIGDEVRDAFLAHDPRAAEAFIATRAGHWRMDLYALARVRLADAGVVKVHGGGLCTISDARRFYSHRRSTLEAGGHTGRMATLVAMTG